MSMYIFSPPVKNYGLKAFEIYTLTGLHQESPRELFREVISSLIFLGTVLLITFPFSGRRVGKQMEHWQQVYPVGRRRLTAGVGRKDECLKHGKCAARASASAAECAAGHAEADTCIDNCF